MVYEIRHARMADCDAALEFCLRIWRERDYSSANWGDWIGNPRRVMLVAADGKRPLGIIRGEMISAHEGWVEGVRVDPLCKSGGIGSGLVEAVCPALRRMGAKCLRSLVALDNAASQRIFQKNGFRVVSFIGSAMIKRRTKPLEAGAAPAQLACLGRADESMVSRALEPRGATGKGSSFLEGCGGLYCCDGVRWRTWNSDALAKHLEGGEVWSWMAPVVQAIAVVTTNPARPGVLDVGLLEGSGVACRGLLAALTKRSSVPWGSKEYPPCVRTFLPLGLTRFQRAAAEAGFRSERVRHKAMHLFEWRMAGALCR